MTIAEYGLWSHLREISHKHQYQYKFDDRSIANRFAADSVSKDTVNRLRRSLTEKGWIVFSEPSFRGPDGKFLPQVGRILSHEEYATGNPDTCITCDTGTSLKSGSQPVSPVRHKSINTKSIKEEIYPVSPVRLVRDQSFNNIQPSVQNTQEHVAAPTVAAPKIRVPDSLFYDFREHKWFASPNIKRGLTAEESALRVDLNKEGIRPEMTEVA
jgi:hypothetical protein